MIKKEHLWFLTLFSLILVLSVYYITMPSDLLYSTQVFNQENKEKDVESSDLSINLEESDILVSLRLDLEDERKLERKNLESILTNSDASIDEKNTAYEKINYLNSINNDEVKIEGKIKECCNISSFVEIKNDEVNVVGISKEHSVSLANDIMRAVQDEFDRRVIVSVSFK